MNIKRSIIYFSIFMRFIFFATLAFSSEISGWVKSETCWVLKEPKKDAKIVGIIKQKAAVTVENLGNGWGKTIFAPVRNLIEGRDGRKRGQLYNCEGCYIELQNISTAPPGMW